LTPSNRKSKIIRLVTLSINTPFQQIKHLTAQYAKSHSLDIPNSLIAATALENRSKLFTYNTNNFRFIAGLKIL